MKEIIEEYEINELDKGVEVSQVVTEDTPNCSYIDAVKRTITAKSNMMNLYDQILGIVDAENLPKSISSAIREIKEDEEDHLSVLKNLLMDEVEDRFSEIVEEDEE